MDRQTFFFLLFLFTFYYLQSGAEQVQPDERHALHKFEEELKDARETLLGNQYWKGYGNLTGFHLSYGDNLKGLNVSEFDFDPVNHPFVENQKYSILPDNIRDEIIQFWDPINSDVTASNEAAYLLNISGSVIGEFTRTEKNQEEDSKIKPLPLKLPKYLQDFDEEYNRGQFEDAKRRYEEDPDHNPPPEYYQPPLLLMGNISTGTWKMFLNLRNSDYNFNDDRVSKFIQKNNLPRIDDAVLVKANINIKDMPESESHDLSTEGVYFQNSGCLVTTTTSGKFLGYNALPHFAFDIQNYDYYNESKVLLGQLINLTDFNKEVSVDTMHTYLSNAKTNCEFINWFKFGRTEYTKDQLRAIDNELRKPQGIPLPSKLPELVITDYLLYSPDCGVKISYHAPDSDTTDKGVLKGERIEVFYKRSRVDLTWFFGISFVQLILLLRQIKRLHTPSALSSVSTASMYTIGLYDSILTMGFILFSPLASKLYLLTTSIAIIRGIICVFEFLFIVRLLTAQSNERGSSWWEIMRGGFTSSSHNESTTSNTTETETVTTPAVAEAQPNAPVGPPDAQVVFTGPDENYYYNGLMASLISLTIVFFFMIIQVSYWRRSYRHAFEFIVLFIFSSMWLPQFLRSTVKNRRFCCFQWEFIFGMSLIRLIPIWYMYLYKNNPYKHYYSPVSAGILTGYVLVQIFLLMLQERLGARFWVNDRWLPQAFDYQPIMSIGDIENGFASDIFANLSTGNGGEITGPTSEEMDNDGWLVCKTDCAVCMNPIEVPLRNDRYALIDSNKKKQSALKRMWKKKRDYMITPCHHIFHQECLEDWMKYKLLCPICRNSLPPI